MSSPPFPESTAPGDVKSGFPPSSDPKPSLLSPCERPSPPSLSPAPHPGSSPAHAPVVSSHSVSCSWKCPLCFCKLICFMAVSLSRCLWQEGFGGIWSTAVPEPQALPGHLQSEINLTRERAQRRLQANLICKYRCKHLQ